MGLNFWTGTKHFGTSRRTRHIKTFLEKSNYLLNMSAIVINLSTTCGLSKQTTSTKSHCTATRGSATLCSTFWKGKFLILVCMISDYPQIDWNKCVLATAAAAAGSNILICRYKIKGCYVHWFELWPQVRKIHPSNLWPPRSLRTDISNSRFKPAGFDF